MSFLKNYGYRGYKMYYLVLPGIIMATLIKKRLWLCGSFCLLSFLLSAQSFDKQVNDAYLITRMVEKFHVQPRALDDNFSKNVFTQLFRQIDKDRIFFTKEDMNALGKFEYSIDDEIKSRQSDFLKAVAAICNKRLPLIDTMILNICKTPFSFLQAEKITVAEDTSYPANEKPLRIKLYKFLKASVLSSILDDDHLATLSSSQQKKYVDSIEPAIRQKAGNSFKHSVDIIFESANGINEALGTEYCKAIAVCYDPHTEYFPLTEKENFESELGQQSMIFGFQFKEENDGTVKIDNVAPGSPAFKSGQINKGDRIKSIQWGDQPPIDVSSVGLQQLSDVIDMSNHDKATFRIQKPDGSERVVVLYKEKSGDDENKVKSFLLKGSKTIGFISLPAFYEDWENESTGVNGCANDVAKEILKLKREKIEGLILDLRYNGGGSVQEAVELAGIFIDAGPVAQFKNRDPKIFTLKDSNRGSIWDGPLILLVNGYSASASEMVAGSLQDYNRALIVGSPTYGKATAQVILPMDSTISLESDISTIKTDSYLKVTISQLYRVTGNTAQAKGVQPDIVLPDILDAMPQREADEPNALISSPVAGNKYFTPGPPIAVDNLKSFAKAKVDSSAFFSALKKYIANEKARDAEDISLKLSDALHQSEQDDPVGEKDLSGKEKAPYSVQNNLYDQQQMQTNEQLKEANDQWAAFLSKDPYLQLAYDLIVMMK
jgi:carboxyl-terminal processing protease